MLLNEVKPLLKHDKYEILSKKNEKTARKSREEMGKKRGEIECEKPLLKHDKYEISSKKRA